jgi:hypothetical protein
MRTRRTCGDDDTGGGVLFHLGTGLFLGITFWPVVATYLVCVPWTRLVTGRRYPARRIDAMTGARGCTPPRR